MYKALRTQLSTAVLAVLLAPAAHAAGSTKDIVLDRLAAPAVVASVGAPIAAPTQDAMALSVLLESPDGTLTPKSTDTVFRTGDRIRIKVVASRNATVSIYNTTPRGELKANAVWRGSVVPGQETVTPRMVMTNESGAGTEQLHFVLEPAAVPANLLVWLGHWFDSFKSASKGSGSKDIRLDVQHTPQATYSLTPVGQGVVNTLRITHY